MHTSFRTAVIVALAAMALPCAGCNVSDDKVMGPPTVEGDPAAEGDRTATEGILINGRFVAAVPAQSNVADSSSIFVELWRLDQQHNGMSVSLRGRDGEWEDESADLRLDEQRPSTSARRDNAPGPLLIVNNHAKLQSPTYRTVRALFDNYNAREGNHEDALGDNATEDAEIDAFLDAVMATEVMTLCLDHINDEDLHPGEHDLSQADLEALLKKQWFRLFTNHFGEREDVYCSGFEHVFLGEHNGRTAGGHHFWWKFYLDQEGGVADSLGHNYGGPPGERYPWLATFRMRWTPQPGTTLTEPERKGFFVGCSPELMLAYGTLGLLWEQAHGGNHPVVTLDGGRFELTVHASTLPGAGDPDHRRGDQIRSVFPMLRSFSAGPTGDELSVARALSAPAGKRVEVVGIITAPHNDEYGLKLADNPGDRRFLVVKLPPTFRPEFNPERNPSARGKQIIVDGTRGKYTGLEGLVDVTSIAFVE